MNAHTHIPVHSPIFQAAALLRDGGIVAFPTETVYGLGANAFDPYAVARVFEVKGRPRIDPLIVHLADVAQVHQAVSDFPEIARRLAERFWPGPLTLILPKNTLIPDIVTAGLSNVAVRVPDHTLTLELLKLAGVPVAAPSANLFGRTSPTTAQHVRDQLGDKVDMVLDGGPCRLGIESTIVSLVGDRPELMRLGGATLEDLERVVGGPLRPAATVDHPVAPGQMRHHYAPRTPLVLLDSPQAGADRGRVGLLSFRAPRDGVGYAAVEVLSPSGDLREAAAHLFAAMHRLDAADLDLIVAERLPARGLGLAINDRLTRAGCGRHSVGSEAKGTAAP